MGFDATSYLRLLQALLPRGRAWNRDEGSTLTEVLQAQADELARVDGRSDDLIQEKDTRYASELLTEHETDLGLPDNCSLEGETIQERRRAAHARLITLGQQNPAYFIELAAAFGWTITITEYTPFWCGVGVCGDPCGDQETIFYWKVTISYGGGDIVYFLCGSSESGDPLAYMPGTTSLICMLNKYKPAHTTLRFDYDGPEFNYGFDSGFDSMPSEMFLSGSFGMGFSIGFDSKYNNLSWVEKAPKLGAETYILSLAVFNSKLYGGTGPNGKLYEWNNIDAWVEKAPKLGAETYIRSLAVFNSKLYGGTYPNGKLYEWNGVDAWVEKAPKLGTETYIYSLAVFNSKLYGGTYPNGKLYEWNNIDAWVEKAPKLGAETYILSLAVFNSKLYGGTYANGKLYEWNNIDAWVEKAPKLGTETRIYSLAVFNSKLYGGTYPNGKLYEWNGVDAWVEKAPKLGTETYIYSLAVFNSKLYGGTGPNGKLYEWNNIDAWVEKAPKLGTETDIRPLAVFNSKLYGGTYPNGKLYEWY